MTRQEKAQVRRAKRLTALAALPMAAALVLTGCNQGEKPPAPDEAENTAEAEETESAFGGNEESSTETESASADSGSDSESADLVEATFTKEDPGVSAELIYYYDEATDLVKRQTTKNVYNYAELGRSKEELQSALDPEIAKGQGVEGYTQSIEYGETEAVEHVEVDYEVVDPKELATVPGFEADSEVGANTKIAMEPSRQMLESQGYVEK